MDRLLYDGEGSPWSMDQGKVEGTVLSTTDEEVLVRWDDNMVTPLRWEDGGKKTNLLKYIRRL